MTLSMQMETDPPSSDYSEQVGSTQEERISSQTRSYDCNFCKKGFSNAQALGGHMNIHRRERLKYKQPSKDNQIPIDLTTKKIPSYPPIPSLQPQSTVENRSCATIRWPWGISGEDGGSGAGNNEVGLRQLPFFVDTQAGDDDRRLGVYGTHEESRMPSIGDSGEEQLDLELRLGPEPPPDTSNGLKEFL